METRYTSAQVDELLATKADGAESSRLDTEAADLKRLFAAMRDNSEEVARQQHQLGLVSERKHGTAWSGKGLAWAACCAVVALGVGVPLETHHHRQALREEAQKREQMLQEQQKTDEALLMNVENDLSSSMPESLQPLSVKFASTTSSETKGNNQ